MQIEIKYYPLSIYYLQDNKVQSEGNSKRQIVLLQLTVLNKTFNNNKCFMSSPLNFAETSLPFFAFGKRFHKNISC